MVNYSLELLRATYNEQEDCVVGYLKNHAAQWQNKTKDQQTCLLLWELCTPNEERQMLTASSEAF